MDGPTNSHVKERPSRRKTASSRDENGVVELPWPEEKEGEPKAERAGARDSTAQPRTKERPHAERPAESKPSQPRAKEKPQTEKPAGTKPPPERSLWTRTGPVIIGIIVVAIAAGLLWWALKPSQPKVSYTLAKAAVATVTVTAHAQGRLAARNPVDVIAPAGARLESAAAKSGDHVRQGQILARLVSESARSDAADAIAEAAAAQSSVALADADVTEARAVAMRARSSNTPGAADTANARLARAMARAREARASLGAVQTRLATARGKLDGLMVRAPFDGVVLRSSLETPEPVRTVARGQTLFTLVRNLGDLELTADFPENSVGPLRVGQQSLFTVAAYPRRTFAARLDAIGTWPKIIHKEGGDVTAYSGTLSASNPDESLRPGMNADVAVVLAQAKNVLSVPNTALIFRPAAEIEAKYKPPKAAYPAPAPRASASSPAKALGPPASPAGSWSPVNLSSAPRPGRVWVLDGDTPRPRDIMVGLSDGNLTQVISGELRAGDSVITSAIVQARGSANKS